jgi:hypothetical protein
LKADRDSLIIYELRNASVTYDSTRYNGSFGLRTVGKLTIAGKTREDTIYTSVKMLPDRRYEIVGEKSISMLDFDIDPPSAFFGLIRANENLIVKFDLLASPQYEDIIGEND